MCKLLLIGCLILSLAGCAWLESKGITPEKTQAAGQFIQDKAPLLPGLPGAGVEILGWALAVIGTGWGAWKRNQGRTWKKAAESVIAGVDRAKEKLPEESINALIDALMKEQVKAGTSTVVTALREL